MKEQKQCRSAWIVPLSIGFAIVIIALCWIIFSAPTVPNPVYHDKKLSEWLEEGDPRGGNNLTLEASNAVRQMGTNCIPYVIREVGVQDSGVREFLLVLKRKGWLRLHLRSSYERSQVALRGVFALGDIAIPYAKDGLASPDKDERHGWTLALLYLRKSSPEIIHGLIECLHDEDVAVHAQAAATLATLGTDQPETVLHALLPLLDDKSPYMQIVVAQALAVLGPKAQPAVPKLLSLLNSADPHDTGYVSIMKTTLQSINPNALSQMGKTNVPPKSSDQK